MPVYYWRFFANRDLILNTPMVFGVTRHFRVSQDPQDKSTHPGYSKWIKTQRRGSRGGIGPQFQDEDQRAERRKKSDIFTLKGNFQEADTEDELILGYPWLKENNLAVLTTEGALGCGWENEIILTGWGKEDPNE